jgi:hypothetical protein
MISVISLFGRVLGVAGQSGEGNLIVGRASPPACRLAPIGANFVLAWRHRL